MKQLKVSESEWVVMRVLWNESPLSSGMVIERLNEVNNWSNTTIKTFLSRLVEKNVLGYKDFGRKRMYYPKVSETDCVLNEMKNTIHMIYGGNPNYTTKHFVFYGDNDIDFINQLVLTIENDYHVLSEHFPHSFKDQQSIFIHRTQEQLFSALGLDNAPKWVRVGTSWGIMHLAPRVAFNDRNPNKLLHHILTNLVLTSINRSIPYWLMEGISAFESKWVLEEDLKQIVIEKQDIIKSLELIDFSLNYKIFREGNGQELAYTFIKFIVSNYGYEVLNDFLRHPNEIKRIFKKNSEGLLTEWKEYLYKEYIGG